MAGRTIAIGDIHGCAIAFASLIEFIDLNSTDTLITLGDYVDRGLDSKGVLDQLVALGKRCRHIPILGNHDEMMLHSRNSDYDFNSWMAIGGAAALDSYGSSGTLDRIPAAHFEFLETCVSYFETETDFFLHAIYKPDLPLDQQDLNTLRWLSLRDSIPGAHFSGKTAFLGHTPQNDVLDLGHLVCIDTGCCNDGWLTAIEATTRQVWQVDDRGNRREGHDPSRFAIEEDQ